LKVYRVEPRAVVFIVAGFHVPVMPFIEVNANAGAAEFWHNGAMAVNVGVI
jgi:hypothetical protein